MSNPRFVVSSSPHIRSSENVSRVMLDVIISLSFALIMGVYLFGIRALTVTLTCIAACIVSEFLYRKATKQNQTIGDLSAVVTGLLLGLNLPVTVPLFVPIVGGVFAIVVVKQLFGGMGKNFVNPALAARVFLLSWPGLMTNWVEPVQNPLANLVAGSADAVSTATPLVALKAGALPNVSVFEAFLGYCPGTIGETSTIILIAGGLYLIFRKVITWHIPVAYVGTVAAITYLFPMSSNAYAFMLYQVCSGGLMLGSIFMATDYVTAPVSGRGKIIYGVGCGAITVFIRYFGGYPEGVSFSILIMNILVWFIDKYTTPKGLMGGAKGGR